MCLLKVTSASCAAALAGARARALNTAPAPSRHATGLLDFQTEFIVLLPPCRSVE